MIKNTTFKCPKNYYIKIKEISNELDMYVSEFVNHSLNENLPLQTIPHFKKSVEIEKAGVRIPESILKRISENQFNLSTDIRKIKQWEIILHCVLLQIEKSY